MKNLSVAVLDFSFKHFKEPLWDGFSMSEFYFDTIGLEKEIMCALSVLPYSVHSENLPLAVLDSKELPWEGFFHIKVFWGSVLIWTL